MSVLERAARSCSTSSPDLDPLLKDLTEKKLSFRRNVASLASELKDVRNKLASQEQLFTRESQTRKVAETKARSMEEEVSKLQKCLLDKDEQLRATTGSTEQYLHDLDELRSRMSVTQATAEASAASAKSAESQCLSLLKELNEKDRSLKEHELRVNKLGEQLALLQKDLEAREFSQRQLKDEVLRIETDIMDAVSKAGSKKDNELLKILSDVSPRNVENISKHLNAKDTEIARLRDEIRILSAHWTNKTKELESQLEKQRRTDQELKKRVLKLEFCLQESRSQIRKLQRVGEKRDKQLKELKDQVVAKHPNGSRHDYNSDDSKHNFWESQGFKFVASMSMLALVILTKR
ncbi:hypothetical protein QYE76_009272 [Lolium multiflorum]|uniref:Uncharacterized protein n=1 Tax=Lolium multiflorum TaxID=4521 RepID=A0AAD8TRN6_LOLMU|nr:hypothetical protein QYE76_009272 [Lolium multiflorum]